MWKIKKILQKIVIKIKTTLIISYWDLNDNLKNKEITIRLLVLFGLVGFVVIFCIFSVIWLFAGTLKNLTKPHFSTKIS